MNNSQSSCSVDPLNYPSAYDLTHYLFINYQTPDPIQSLPIAVPSNASKSDLRHLVSTAERVVQHWVSWDTYFGASLLGREYWDTDHGNRLNLKWLIFVLCRTGRICFRIWLPTPRTCWSFFGCRPSDSTTAHKFKSVAL